MLKKSFISLCVLLIILQSGITALYTVAKLYHHKALVKSDLLKQINSGLVNPNIKVFSADDLVNAEWEHDKEFFLGERKFDVLKKEENTSSTKFYCVEDNNELLLLKSLNDTENKKVKFEDIIKKIQLQEHKVLSSVLLAPKAIKAYGFKSASKYSYSFNTDAFKPPMI